MTYTLPKPGALNVDRGNAAPPVGLVAVVATAPTWRMDGSTVEVGRTYRVPPDVAAGLEYRGKARRA